MAPARPARVRLVRRHAAGGGRRHQHFVHADHLDRPFKMTNGSKAVVWDTIYRPFGAVDLITGTARNNLRFPGQYFLLESGLHYNRHRHYDPTIGRYLQTEVKNMTYVQLLTHLADKFARQAAIRKLDSGDVSEAEKLAHALCDLKESFEKYLAELLPKLIEANDEDVVDHLQAIGDEFRHVAYHLRDPKFFEVYVGALAEKHD
jgi:RHS repeat-associated protein